MYPHRGQSLALVLLLFVLIVVLSVLVVVLFLVLIVVLFVLVLVLIVVLVLHNEHSFFVIWELRSHYARLYSLLCVLLSFDCHARWSSKAYRKEANAMVDALTIGREIHQIHG